MLKGQPSSVCCRDYCGGAGSYQASLEFGHWLAQSERGNAGWQRDLTVSYAKLAVVQLKMGVSADALSALQQGQAIMVRMTQLSPDNAVWKSDLAWFNDQIAQTKPSR